MHLLRYLTGACRKTMPRPGYVVKGSSRLEYVVKVRPWIMTKTSLIGTDITDLFCC